MRLRPILLSAEGDAADPALQVRVRHDDEPGVQRCDFCGGSTGGHDFVTHDAVSCVLCLLPRRLHRPRINDEGMLIWLPEMSQAALNVLVREIHLGSGVAGDNPVIPGSGWTVTLERKLLYHAAMALRSRAPAALTRLGTDRPGELGYALRQLPRGVYQGRGRLLGGLRLLPMGHCYEGGHDIYPRIVNAWMAEARAATAASSSAVAP